MPSRPNCVIRIIPSRVRGRFEITDQPSKILYSRTIRTLKLGFIIPIQNYLKIISQGISKTKKINPRPSRGKNNEVVKLACYRDKMLLPIPSPK